MLQTDRIKNKAFDLHIIKTKKFKTIDFSIRFLEELSKEYATKRSLLPFVLKASSKNFPTKKDVMKRLEYLYGSTCNVNVSKVGLGSVISIGIKVAVDQNNKNIIYDAIDFLHEIIFNPLLENGAFTNKVVAEEKRLLIDEFSALADDKTKYAMQRLVEEMCKDEPYAVPSLGYIEDLDSIDGKNLFDYYQHVLTTNRMDIIVNGDIDDQLIQYISEKWNYRDNNFTYNIVDTPSMATADGKEIVETQNINQTKINIGYRTMTSCKDKDYYAFFMFNAILGGYPHSKLFTNVREKNSLCYYVASRYDALKGMVLIYAGIEEKQYKKALSIIQEQIAIIQQGNVSDEELELTRKGIINDLKEAMDSQGSVSIKLYNDAILNRSFSVEERIAAINNVTKEEIISSSKIMELDKIFLLKGAN